MNLRDQKFEFKPPQKISVYRDAFWNPGFDRYTSYMLQSGDFYLLRGCDSGKRSEFWYGKHRTLEVPLPGKERPVTARR